MREPWEVGLGAGFLILGLFLAPGGFLVALSKLTGAEPTASLPLGVAMCLLGVWMIAVGHYLALTFRDDDEETR